MEAALMKFLFNLSQATLSARSRALLTIWPLLEIKSVFQDKGPGKYVRVLFTWETDRNSCLFSRQTGPLHVCHSLYPRKHASFPAVDTNVLHTRQLSDLLPNLILQATPTACQPPSRAQFVCLAWTIMVGWALSPSVTRTRIDMNNLSDARSPHY